MLLIERPINLEKHYKIVQFLSHFCFVWGVEGGSSHYEKLLHFNQTFIEFIYSLLCNNKVTLSLRH